MKHYLISIISLPLLIISAIILFIQLRSSAKATISNVYQNVTYGAVEIDKIFIDNPELRKYFYYNNIYYGNKTSELYDKISSIAEMFFDFADSVNTQIECMPKKKSYPWETWKKYFKDLYKRSPILREYWENNKQWYPDSLDFIFEPKQNKS